VSLRETRCGLNSAHSEDRYGRALFYVYIEAGESMAEKLIGEGLGKAWEQDGPHRESLMPLQSVAMGVVKLGLLGLHKHRRTERWKVRIFRTASTGEPASAHSGGKSWRMKRSHKYSCYSSLLYSVPGATK